MIQILVQLWVHAHPARKIAFLHINLCLKLIDFGTRFAIRFPDIDFKPSNLQTLKPSNPQTLKHSNTQTLKHSNLQL